MMAKRPRGRPAIPREVQRQRLIDAALRAIQKAHYEKVSVALIVREAGMSSRSFYDHFVSKEDLIAEIVERSGSASGRACSSGSSARRRAIANASSARCSAYLELFPAGTVDLERLGGEAGQRVRELRQKYVMVLTDLVLESVRAGARSAESRRECRCAPRSSWC